MARGGPDYKASNSYYGQSLTDVGELAARIGSIDLLDRKGVVLYAEDFGNLLSPWYKTGPIGWEIEPVGELGYLNTIVTRFHPLIAGPGAGSIQKSMPVIQLKKYGFECMFRLNYTGAAAPGSFYMTLNYYSGTRVRGFGLYVDPAAEDIKYITMVGGFPAWAHLDNIPANFWITGNTVYYNYLKLVIDLELMRYDRYIFNSQGGSMITRLPTNTASTLAPHIDFILGVDGAPTLDNIYAANPILTMDEP